MALQGQLRFQTEEVRALGPGPGPPCMPSMAWCSDVVDAGAKTVVTHVDYQTQVQEFSQPVALKYLGL